jgi:hypothetical protein
MCIEYFGDNCSFCEWFFVEGTVDKCEYYNRIVEWHNEDEVEE